MSWGKGLFGVVLVAASFAGGAVANGPMLNRAGAWLRASSWGVVENHRSDPFIPDADPPEVWAEAPRSSPRLEPPVVEPAPPAGRTPSRAGSEPALVAPDRTATASQPSSDPSTAAAHPTEPAPLDLDLKFGPLPLAALGTGTAEATPNVSKVDPALAPAVVAPEPPEPEVEADAGRPARPQPQSEFPAAPAPASQPARAASNERDPEHGDEPNWSELDHRMRELGVTRYWIEGQPDGPVRFRCVVPLAGGQAVSQHFEAQAETAAAAAHAALRRIALWRATEPE